MNLPFIPNKTKAHRIAIKLFSLPVVYAEHFFNIFPYPFFT